MSKINNLSRPNLPAPPPPSESNGHPLIVSLSQTKFNAQFNVNFVSRWWLLYQIWPKFMTPGLCLHSVMVGVQLCMENSCLEV